MGRDFNCIHEGNIPGGEECFNSEVRACQVEKEVSIFIGVTEGPVDLTFHDIGKFVNYRPLTLRYSCGLPSPVKAGLQG